MTRHPILTSDHLRSICQTIADTNDGVTGSQIAKLLGDSGILDIDPSNTKWKHLYNACINWRHKNGCSNNILDFLRRALSRVNYIGRQEVFEDRRHEVNQRLSFIGFEITERGTLANVSSSKTISEAEQRANRFKHKLGLRNVHAEIFKYCESEIADENYFHTVFESVKSVADWLRFLSNLHADGMELADTAFQPKII